MPFPLSIQLSIKQKIIVGITVFFVAVGIVGLLSYRNLRIMGKKIKFVELADDLSNIILEIRRYEKNFFLYGLSELDALNQNEEYIEDALILIKKLSGELESLEGAPKIGILKKELIEYKKLVKKIKEYAKNENFSGIEDVSADMRNKGKLLVELSHELVQFERSRILYIVERLYGHLFSAMILLFIFWGSLVFFVIRKIIQPLKIIEDTTAQIAEGKFKMISVPDTGDETERVIRAFNHMVQELERRQDQLVQAKKLSSLGTLTSGIAHELNNPLNNISTSCQIVIEELDEMDRELLRKMLLSMEKEIGRARDIVKGLLEFSRMKEFVITPANLKEIVSKVCKLVESQLPAGIQIHVEIPDELIVPLDSQRMQQVFLNLFLNSIQAIPEPPGEIRVKAKKDSSNNEVIIHVEDTGIGMDKETISHIFDPFFTTKEVGVGTGLGLSIVHGIIEQHNGTISVESKKNEGTRFTIRLPLNQAI